MVWEEEKKEWRRGPKEIETTRRESDGLRPN
jgi:hypothetical protein